MSEQADKRYLGLPKFFDISILAVHILEVVNCQCSGIGTGRVGCCKLLIFPMLSPGYVNCHGAAATMDKNSFLSLLLSR